MAMMCRPCYVYTFGRVDRRNWQVWGGKFGFSHQDVWPLSQIQAISDKACSPCQGVYVQNKNECPSQGKLSQQIRAPSSAPVLPVALYPTLCYPDGVTCEGRTRCRVNETETPVQLIRRCKLPAFASQQRMRDTHGSLTITPASSHKHSS